MQRIDRLALAAALVAAVLGAASAAVSAYWALGGTSLLDTVGGEIERWGRERSAAVVITLWLLTAAKLVAGAAPLVFVGVGPPGLVRWSTAPPVRAAGWIVAVGLTMYGGLLTIGGVLVDTGAMTAAADADRHAIAWHAYFWDPWFALWGGAFVVAMARSRRRGGVASGR